MNSDRGRLHPVYRWLAGILGSATLLVQPIILTDTISLTDKIGLFVGGLGMGSLFLYCAITGSQYDYKPETGND